jgi:hypothetical protein
MAEAKPDYARLWIALARMELAAAIARQFHHSDESGDGRDQRAA